jgi:hypothetical protein
VDALTESYRRETTVADVQTTGGGRSGCARRGRRGWRFHCGGGQLGWFDGGRGDLDAAAGGPRVWVPARQGGGGIFTDRCRFSHEAADDPILMPNMAGQSMQHDFYGNTTTSASSTASTLLGKPTTCSTSADASAYWTPVLYQNGQPLQPVSALIYWRQTKALASMVKPMPAGISLIAGDEKATQPQSPKVIRWTCSGDEDTRDVTSTPHDCSGDRMLRLIVTFPSCWDGHTLDGAAQTSAVYPVDGRCPASHPVVIPQSCSTSTTRHQAPRT